MPKIQIKRHSLLVETMPSWYFFSGVGAFASAGASRYRHVHHFGLFRVRVSQQKTSPCLTGHCIAYLKRSCRDTYRISGFFVYVCVRRFLTCALQHTVAGLVKIDEETRTSFWPFSCTCVGSNQEITHLRNCNV